MDKEVLKRQLTERFQQSLEAALKAVDQAPDGQWIAASEWEVRDIFQKLTADCFGQMIQQRMDQLPSASQAAFSPGRELGGGGQADAEQRKPPRAGAHRGRRD
jgi:hypothetical protein